MPEPGDRRDRMVLTGAWSVWVVATILVCVIVVRGLLGPEPNKHLVTPVYRAAAEAWWAANPLYTDPENGFLYLPQSAILYTPFIWGPPALGEVLWRLVCSGVFASGLWRLVRMLVLPTNGPMPAGDVSAPARVCAWARRFVQSPGHAFLLATIVCLPLAVSNLRNGQSNLPLAGLMLHAAVDLSASRWSRAALVLCLMTALKPLGLVMVLLAAVLYPRTAWRLAAGMIGVAALPLLSPSPAYAVDQYRGAIETLNSASRLEMPRGQDLRGLLAAVGLAAPPVVLMAIRLAAAPLMLGIAWLGKRRFGEPAGALFTLAAAAVYLTLFNPRCEGVTYIVLSPAIAGCLIAPRYPGVRWLLFGISIAVALSQVFTGGPNSWMRPIAAGLFLALLVLGATRGGRPLMVENQPVPG